MRALPPEVHRLLTEQFSTIEAVWDQHPDEEVVALALTIKEFMADHKIAAVADGIRSYQQFKEEQGQELALLGLGGSPEPRRDRPAAVRLATEAV